MHENEFGKGLERIVPGKKGGRNLIFVFLLLFALVPSLAAEEAPLEGQTSAGEQVGVSTAKAPQYSLDEAIGLARQRITAAPSDVKEQVTLGYLLLKKGSHEEAGKAFDGALSLNARTHEALTGKGIALARMGKNQVAEEFLQKALILNPNPVRTYRELGLLYENKGDFAKAVIEYKKGLEKYKQGRK
jgi:tetratricopeptide (TPR) repeat protein